MERTTTFTEFCKEFIHYTIYAYIGQRHYGCDLASYLTQGINRSGTATYNIYKSRELINDWWRECGDFVSYYKANFGEVLNPFESEDRFICVMVICGVETLIGQSKTAQSIWDENAELSYEILASIADEIEELPEIEF